MATLIEKDGHTTNRLNPAKGLHAKSQLQKGSSTEKLVASVPVNLGDERLKALRPSKFQQNMATLLEVNFILDLDEAENPHTRT